MFSFKVKINWNKILFCQQVINLIFSLWLVFAGIKLSNVDTITNQIIIIVLLLSIILKTSHNNSIELVSLWVNIVGLPFSFLFLFVSLLVVLSQKISWGPVFIIQNIILVLVLIPVIKTDYKNLISWSSRFIATLILIESINVFIIPTIGKNIVIHQFNNSGLINFVMLLCLLLILFYEWGLKLKFNLPFKLKNRNLYVLIFWCIFTIWFILFVPFSQRAFTISQAFINWNFDLIDTSQTSIDILGKALNSVRAGTFEELARYALVVLGLNWLKNKRYFVSKTVFLSSIILGLSHFTNIFIIYAGHNGLIYVTQQMIMVFGVSCYFALLYLYIGKIWIMMLAHASMDFVSMMMLSSDTTLNLGLYDPYNWSIIVIVTIVAIFAATFLLMGSSKKIIESNAKLLIVS